MTTEKRAVLRNSRAAVRCLIALGWLSLMTVQAHAATATHTVVIEAMEFKPAIFTVKKGDRVVWVNKDLFPHTATASDRSFDSKEIPAGKRWIYIATVSGNHPYVCSLHPTMKESLITD